VADLELCSSSEDRCGLSFEGHGLTPLFDLIRVIEARCLEGRNADDFVARLHGYVKFYQTGQFCSNCHSELIRTSRPTVQLNPSSEEYRRAARTNQALDARDRLQALRVLPL
jgi:hypothetical protein